MCNGSVGNYFKCENNQEGLVAKMLSFLSFMEKHKKCLYPNCTQNAIRKGLTSLTLTKST